MTEEKKEKLKPTLPEDPYLIALASRLGGDHTTSEILSILKEFMKLVIFRIRAKELQGVTWDVCAKTEEIEEYKKQAAQILEELGLKPIET